MEIRKTNVGETKLKDIPFGGVFELCESDPEKTYIKVENYWGVDGKEYAVNLKDGYLYQYDGEDHVVFYKNAKVDLYQGPAQLVF